MTTWSGTGKGEREDFNGLCPTPLTIDGHLMNGRLNNVSPSVQHYETGKLGRWHVID